MNLPRLRIKQYDGTINPSGSRNLDVIASGFVKHLDITTSGVLDFGYLNITSSGTISPTKCLIFRPEAMGDATQIYNFRMYVYGLSAWGTGTYNFLWKKTIHFTSDVGVTLADENLPTSLPAAQNVLSTASGTFIQDTTESGVSQYIYLALYVGTDVPVGEKGGAGEGSFRYRLTFDFI